MKKYTRIKGSVEHRLKERSKKNVFTKCIEWQGATSSFGYGQLVVNGAI